MTEDRPELPALFTTPQLTYLYIALTYLSSTIFNLRIPEVKNRSLLFRTPFGLWYSLNERKELILHLALAASAEPWLTVRQH